MSDALFLSRNGGRSSAWPGLNKDGYGFAGFGIEHGPKNSKSSDKHAAKFRYRVVNAHRNCHGNRRLEFGCMPRVDSIHA